MDVAVIGAGGMGSYFGAVLARGGCRVTMVARGDRLRAIAATGLHVASASLGDFSVRVDATDTPASVGAVDLVLVCVKTYDVSAAAHLVAPLLGSETRVLPIQNGVDAPPQLEAVIGAGPVLGGVSWVTAHAPTPGKVVHARGSRLLFGELRGQPSDRLERLRAGLTRAGVEAEIARDIQVALWEKLMGVCVVAGLAGVTRLPLGPIFASPELRHLARCLLDETARVARAREVGLSDDVVERSLASLETIARSAPAAYPSLYEDIVHGRPIELDALHGAVVRMGRESGIATPVSACIAALLSPYLTGTPPSSERN